MNAAERRGRRVLALLLDRGAGMERCALAAAWGGQAGNLRWLLARGADPNGADRAGRTPLMIAAENGDRACVDALLACGALPDATDRDGQTALMAAARSDNETICRLLVEAGADRGRRDKQGRTAQDHLFRFAPAELRELLRP
jgi:ankyrin repeat protein